MTSINPLKQYFRQAAIYVRLPSNGQYYPEGTVSMPANGEMPVYPMTAMDEITYKTPDALFNGQAVVDVIKSCIPNIRDPWVMPAVDVDTALVAIRIATYGHELEIETACPHCAATANYGLDLRTVLDKMKAPDYSKSIKNGDLEIFFRPMTYKNLNDNNQAQFEEQKILQLIPDSEIPEDQRMTALSKALKNLTHLTFRALAQSIAAVKTPDAFVTEQDFIVEMLENCDRSIFNQIRDHVIKTKAESEIQPLVLNCTECKKEYQQAMTLDMTSFFGAAS